MVPGTWYTQDWSTPINEAGNRQWGHSRSQFEDTFPTKHADFSSAKGHSCLAENAHVGSLKEVAEVEVMSSKTLCR